jgi:hypothetical protein
VDFRNFSRGSRRGVGCSSWGYPSWGYSLSKLRGPKLCNARRALENLHPLQTQSRTSSMFGRFDSRLQVAQRKFRNLPSKFTPDLQVPLAKLQKTTLRYHRDRPKHTALSFARGEDTVGEQAEAEPPLALLSNFSRSLTRPNDPLSWSWTRAGFHWVLDILGFSILFSSLRPHVPPRPTFRPRLL